MADFRKWLLVLAVVALVAVPVSAQTCNLAPGNPTNIRDGGLTELIGDMVLTCTGGTAPLTVNVQIFVQNAVVSNRVKAGGTIGTTPQCPFAGLGNCVTDSLLLINDVTSFATPATAPIPGLLQPAVAGADSPTNRNSILFPGVVLPAGSTTTLRITNIRIVAPPLNTVVLGLPTQVIESVSFLPQVTVQPSFEVVANVLPAMQYAVDVCSGQSLNFKQCLSVNAGLAGSTSSQNAQMHFRAKFTEGFPLAFKPRGDTSLIIPGVSSLINLFESGLTLAPTAAVPGGAWDGTVFTGLANTGTKLQVNFKNIPQGVNVYVTQTPTVTGTTTGFTAVPAAEAGTAIGGTARCASGDTAQGLMALNAANAAVWEVTSTGTPTSQRQVSFGVVIAYLANTTLQLPALTGSTPMTTTGQLAPVSAVAQASTTATIPRFRDVQQAAGSVSIGPCATTLLYPFTTNKAGFETGLAIINTSLDNFNSTGAPLKTPTQTGNCLVYFFDGSTSAPTPVDTGSIAPGAQYVNTISGLTSGAAFQGYVIARCNFQFGHGYAYITDISSSRLGAQGYLALIIPDFANQTRQPDPFSAQGAGAGEQLVF